VQEIAEKLGQLVDPQTGERCVRRVAVAHQFFSRSVPLRRARPA
jgi:hypothetical protein